jgi:aldose 1-epimerase
VKGTPFDFRQPTAIGARINQDEEQLKHGHGYDHAWVLDGRARLLRRAAEAYDPTTARSVEVWTTEPGLHLYSGNFLGEARTGKGGKAYKPHDGFALETQHFADSPNKPNFPSTVLRKGEKYRSKTIYRFSAR